MVREGRHEMAKLLQKNELPEWFEYTAPFKRIVDYGLVYFEPWSILECRGLKECFEGLQQRYPVRQLIPFARSEDNDDVAADMWEK